MECLRNCIGCDKYRQRKQCEAFKERRRAIRRRIYQFRKAQKAATGGDDHV